MKSAKYQRLDSKHQTTTNFLKAPKWIVFGVISVLVVLYLVLALPVSLVTNEKSQMSLAKFSDQVNQVKSTSDKIDELTQKFSALSKKINKQLELMKQAKQEEKLSMSIPERIQLNNTQTYAIAEKESNLALFYWERWNDSRWEKATVKSPSIKYCSNVSLTDPFKVRHNNAYWQELIVVPQNITEMFSMYLYNAYYDKRVEDAPVVTLITANANDKLAKKRRWWCLLWFEHIKAPVLVQASHYFTLMGDKKGNYHPQLITCPVPIVHVQDVPQAVSLQTKSECDQVEQVPSNVLRVIYEPRQGNTSQSRIGVCVQAFRFATYDISVRLVEWLEMVRLMGADKVHFSVYSMMETTRKVLQHYQKQGFVDWRKISLPGTQPNIDSLYNLWAFKLGEYFWPTELIELNDCLYRNLYLYDYLAVIDVDEMIVPQKVSNWHELIKSVESKLSSQDRARKGYYSSRHSHVCEVFQEETYHKQSIPSYLYMMRHTYRAKLMDEWSNIKCFHRTDLVTAVHNHAPISCKGYQFCQGVTIDPEDSVLWHYRRNQSQPGYTNRNTDCPIHDTTTWRYYDSLQENVRKQLQSIFVN